MSYFDFPFISPCVLFVNKKSFSDILVDCNCIKALEFGI